MDKDYIREDLLDYLQDVNASCLDLISIENQLKNAVDKMEDGIDSLKEDIVELNKRINKDLEDD